MKPLDLERALSGDPVITRDGRKVLKISYFPDAIPGSRLICLVEGIFSPKLYNDDGRITIGGYHEYGDYIEDLFMAPKKIKGYIAISNKVSSDGRMATSCFAPTKELLYPLSLKDCQIIEVEIDE